MSPVLILGILLVAYVVVKQWADKPPNPVVTQQDINNAQAQINHNVATQRYPDLQSFRLAKFGPEPIKASIVINAYQKHLEEAG